MMLSIAKQYHAKAAAEARDSPEGPKPKLGFVWDHALFPPMGPFGLGLVCIHAF